MNTLFGRCSTAVCALAPFLMFVQVSPVAVAAETIEEVVVTARKREESLQDVPVAIQAFQKEQIEKFAATDLETISDMANNVEITTRGSQGGGSVFNIRGMAASAEDAGIDSSVAVNIDGVQSSRGWITHMGYYDLQSVQILKGPQALFYGKDSPAGVVGVTSASPTDEFEAKFMVGFETEAEEQIYEAMVSGPITENLNGRIFARYSDMKGWIENVAQRVEPNASNPYFLVEPYALPGDLSTPGADETMYFRVSLDWTPSDNFKAKLRYHDNRIVSEGFAADEVGRCGDPLTGTPTGNTVFIQPIFGALFGGPFIDPFADCKVNGKSSTGGVAPQIAENWSHPNANSGKTSGAYWGKSDSNLVSLNLSWDLAWATVESISGYFHYDARGLDNFGGRLYPAMLGFNPDEQVQRSQELRLVTQFDSPVNFMVGAYYDEFDRNHSAAVKLGTFGPDPDTGFGNDLDVRQATNGSSRAYFGQVIWNINDMWEFTAGARYTDDRKTGTQTNVYVHAVYEDLGAVIFGPAGSGLIPPLWRTEGEPLDAAFSDTQTSPEVTLTYRPNNNHTFWLAYKTGYKAGGISNPTLLNFGDTAEDMIFLPEEAEGWEVGSKSMFLDGRLRLNLTAYFYEFENLQVSVLDTTTTVFSIANAGVAETKGIEFDMEYLFDEYLTLRAEFGYNKGEYTEFANSACYEFQPVGPGGCMDLNGDGIGDVQDLSGEPLPNAPEWSGSAGLEYYRPITDEWAISFALTGQYKDETRGTTDGDPNSAQDAWTKIHTRLGLSSLNGTWDIHFIGRNVTDERGDPAGVRPAGITPFDSPGDAGRGRQYLFQVVYNMQR